MNGTLYTALSRVCVHCLFQSKTLKQFDGLGLESGSVLIVCHVVAVKLMGILTLVTL